MRTLDPEPFFAIMNSGRLPAMTGRWRFFSIAAHSRERRQEAVLHGSYDL